MLDCLPLIERSISDGTCRVLLHHVRLSLMLGDYHYSSQQSDPKWDGMKGLYANTDRQTKKFKQKLTEHLVGVTGSALQIAHLLPRFERDLPLVQGVQSLKKAQPADVSLAGQSCRKNPSGRR